MGSVAGKTPQKVGVPRNPNPYTFCTRGCRIWCIWMHLAFTGGPCGEGFTRQGKCSHHTIDRSLEYDYWKMTGVALQILELSTLKDGRSYTINDWRLLNVACSRAQHRGDVQCVGDLLPSSARLGKDVWLLKKSRGRSPNCRVIRTQTWAFVRFASYRWKFSKSHLTI